MHSQHLDMNRARYRDHGEEYWFHYRSNSAANQELRVGVTERFQDMGDNLEPNGLSIDAAIRQVGSR
jgi:hypothetical protein